MNKIWHHEMVKDGVEGAYVNGLSGTRGVMEVVKAKADLLPHPHLPHHHHRHPQSWMTRGLLLGLRWWQKQN